VCVSATLAVLALLSWLFGGEVRRRDGWICAGCGSHKSQTEAFNIIISRDYRESALEKWLKDRNHAHSHDWRHIQGDGMNVPGMVMSRGHGSAPPILMIAIDSLLDDFIKKSTDVEVRKFVDVLANGSEADQSGAVEAAGAKALKD
jgi:hypothetical protein